MSLLNKAVQADCPDDPRHHDAPAAWTPAMTASAFRECQTDDDCEGTAAVHPGAARASRCDYP
ncbi:MAG: hypothetical protein R3F43_18285 [bacterium]